MNVNPPATSEEVKSDGFSSKTKRSYVIGVVDTTGMKSLNANRKRRWDQPPDEESDHVPPKVFVRKVEGSTAKPDQHSVVCDGDPDIEDYDAQYDECISSNNVVSDKSVEEPVPEKTTAVSDNDGSASVTVSDNYGSKSVSVSDNDGSTSVSVSDNDGSTSLSVCDNDGSKSVCVDEKVVESQVTSPKEQSVAGIEPESLPSLPAEGPSTGDSSTDLFNPTSTKIIGGVPENTNSEKKASVSVDKVVGKPAREVAKTVEAIPVAGIISDSLKQIQFCYDEDSNSTEESEVENNIEGVESNETIITKKVDAAVSDPRPKETETSAVNPSEIKENMERSERNRRSPTPVLNDELDESSLPQMEITPNESLAISESKTGAHEVDALNSEVAVSAKLHDSEVNSANSISLVDSSATVIAKVKGELNVEGTVSASPVSEPVSEDIQHSKNQQLNKDLSDADGTIPLLNTSNETQKTLEELESPEPVKIDEVREKGMSTAPIESAPSVNERTLFEETLGTVDAEKDMDKIDESWNGKQFTDSMECNSELSLLKENEMFMEESSDKCASVTGDKLLSKDSGTVGQTNLISMDNSQNCCVGFDDLSSLDKPVSKSPELELRYSDSEDSNKVSSEVTMHFASFRTPENVTETIPESEFEDTKDESEKAIDALISANPDLSAQVVEFQETATSMDGNTMEMLDSLVRRSSEDDPSRIVGREGMLSEDSLINEINQLPDNDDKKTNIDKSPEDDSEPVVESSSSRPKEKLESNDAAKTVDEEPKESTVNTDVSECGSTPVVADPSNPEDKVDSPGRVANEAGDKQVLAKSEGTSIEDELSQGGEGGHKSENVSSENILEVIFGSKQENNIRTVRSEERNVDSKVTQENNKEEKIDGSPVVDIQIETSSTFNDGQQSADDSKLQLNNEEIEIDNTEIVMVDPTKPLSGEDTDNDVDDGSSEKGESINEKAKVTTILPPDVISIDVKTVGQSIPSSESAAQSVSDEELNVKEPSVEVEKSKSSDAHESQSEAEAVIPEPMDVDVLAEPVVVHLDDSSLSKPKKCAKATPTPEVSHAREPGVPVLIIKKQALPSKKEGDKNFVETLLTCSPKAVDNLVSESSTPPRKSLNEGHQMETTQDSTVGLNSPRHSPITLRIYKDNLTVKTDLDSPKRNKSPMSSEFKSELSPKLRSPSVSENLSPQNKQLEFTLKIAKDVNTNFPKATMSPKNVSSPASVWKSEVQIPESPGVLNKEIEDVMKITPLPTRGRGRGRGRGATPRRGMGRGKRGVSQGRNSSVADRNTKVNLDITDACVSSLSTDIVIKQEVVTEEEKSEGSSVGAPLTMQIHDMFQKIISKEGESAIHKSLVGEDLTPGTVDARTPIARKRGRPRKSVQTPIIVPEEMVIIKQEPITPVETTPLVTDGGEDDGSSSTGRPKRTCRGRTKPIVVKKRKPRGGGAAGAGVPRGESTPLPAIEIKEENSGIPVAESVPMEAATPESSSLPAVTPSPPVEKSSVIPTTPARGRGGFKRPTPDRNTLSEKELAELQKIEAKKEKLRLDRIAKYEAKKAKKLAKKLKDEERRKRVAREKAEKAEAAAPQVFEEETRMSAPDSSSRGHTPAPNRILNSDGLLDESQNSISTPGDTNKGNKKGRMEISITDMDCLVKEVRVDELAEYQWQGSELFMIQEQVSLYLGVKSFKRKYPGLKRRPVEAEERTFLEDSGLVPKSMCDLGLTAVGSAEILDIMFQDFPEKYEEFRKHVRDKQAREASFKQKAAIGLQRKDGTKVEPREQALEAVAAWNANLNRERREERRCALDLQTFTVHYPKLDRDNMKKPTPKVGLYPVAVIPGQFCDHYKKYTPNELMYFPVNTVLYGPLRPNERQRDSDDGSGSESSSSSSSSSSSGESSSESESEGDEPARCKMCSGTKKKNKDSIPEVLLTCIQCKSCYHPTCKEFTPEMIVHLTKYEWQCSACKGCSKCRDPSIKDRIMCCQLCDRGYHLACIGLKKMPEGRWHCTVCAYCSSCDSRNPGGSDWQHEFKKGEKGIKIYQRTLCTPCFKLWRKGKYCQLCSKCHTVKPEEDPSLIQCNSCDRWLHKDCYGSKYGLTNKLMSSSSIQCDYCVERITLNSHGINRSLVKV